MHPVWTLCGVLAAALALRVGLQMRKARQRGERRPPEWRRKHLRIAKPAVAIVLIGFLAGPLSSIYLRDWTPFERFHSWVAIVAAGLFGAAAVLGRRMERGEGRQLDAHGWLGLLAVLAAAVAAVSGFVLLP